jgi:hypothetical protein
MLATPLHTPVWSVGRRYLAEAYKNRVNRKVRLIKAHSAVQVGLPRRLMHTVCCGPACTAGSL